MTGRICGTLVSLAAWLSPLELTGSAGDYVRSMILQASALPPSSLPGPSFIPLNEILAADRPFIEVYFMRHPPEMIMNNAFFIQEMNGAVISLLQQSPTVVSETLGICLCS